MCCFFFNMRFSVAVLWLFFTSIHARRPGSLTDLLELSSIQDPVVIVLDPENKLGLMDPDGEEDQADRQVADKPQNEDAYMLYNVLRTQPDDNLDDEVAEKLEETKKALRQALRARCYQLEKCVNKCKPKPKKKQCTVTCQETYDTYDACEDTKPTKPPKCKVDSCNPKWGRTMPPYRG